MIPEEIIIRNIRYIRGVKVILDSDLADMYGVETKRLKEQVKRNISRFPSHFMFELTKEEYLVLRSQFATLKQGIQSIYQCIQLIKQFPFICIHKSSSITHDFLKLNGNISIVYNSYN